MSASRGALGLGGGRVETHLAGDGCHLVGISVRNLAPLRYGRPRDGAPLGDARGRPPQTAQLGKKVVARHAKH